MSKPEDIPQDVQNVGAKMAGEYFAWLNAGNSRGNLSEHAVAAMADTIARAILAAKAEERREIQTKIQDLAVPTDTANSWQQLGYRQCRIDAVAAIRKRGEG